MKKINLLFTVIGIIFTMLGTLTVLADDTAEYLQFATNENVEMLQQDSINAENAEDDKNNKIYAYATNKFSYRTNDKTPKKITSYEELVSLNLEPGSNRRNDYLLEQYPRSFFEDNFLYIYYICGTSTVIDYTITKVEEDESYINIEMFERKEESSDAVALHFLFVEADKSLLNKKLKITTTPYSYNITDLYLSDRSGNKIIKPDTNTDFVVNIDIESVESHHYIDLCIVAVYDEKGAFICMECIEDIKKNINDTGRYSFRVPIPETDREIGSVKAFVWDKIFIKRPWLGSMFPLSEMKELTFTQ